MADQQPVGGGASIGWRLKSRKFWLVVGMTLLNAGLLISGHIEAGNFVTLQSATIAPYLVGQSAVDTWGRK